MKKLKTGETASKAATESKKIYDNEEKWQSCQKRFFDTTDRGVAVKILWNEMEPLIAHACRSALFTKLKNRLFADPDFTESDVMAQAEEMKFEAMHQLLRRWDIGSPKRISHLGNYAYWWIFPSNKCNEEILSKHEIRQSDIIDEKLATAIFENASYDSFEDDILNKLYDYED